MIRAALLVATMVLILVAGVALADALSPVATTTAQTATPPVAVAPSPARSAIVAAPGLCSSPQMTTTAVIERYFELSISNDPRGVSDCFAASWRARFVNSPSWEETTRAWASAGPASGLRIAYGDTVNGCDRYGVAARMASGYPIGQSGSEFITVGLEAGTPRIFEIGTALVNAQNATTTCR